MHKGVISRSEKLAVAVGFTDRLVSLKLAVLCCKVIRKAPLSFNLLELEHNVWLTCTLIFQFQGMFGGNMHDKNRMRVSVAEEIEAFQAFFQVKFCMDVKNIQVHYIFRFIHTLILKQVKKGNTLFCPILPFSAGNLNFFMFRLVITHTHTLMYIATL